MKKLNLLIIALIASVSFIACEKEGVETQEVEKGKMSFSINRTEDGNSLKAAAVYDLDAVTQAVITIEKDGAVVEGFETKTIDISNWGEGNFSTPDITLPVGTDYTLTKFELKDVDNQVIFATPLLGSELADQVTTPLPISFDIAVDATTPVAVDVLSTEEKTLEQFGYANFVVRDKTPVEPAGEPVVGSFTDVRDGKTYKTVTLGNQTWMAENLAYLPEVWGTWDFSSYDPRYNVADYVGHNGMPDKDVTEAKAEANYATYGVMYNIPAVLLTGTDAIAPEGWHIATDEEWKTLEMALGMSQADADAEGETARGTFANDMKGIDWVAGNGTNITEFNVLPGGWYDNAYKEVGDVANFWTSSAELGMNYYSRSFDAASNGIYRLASAKGNGYYVRCVKD